MGIICPPPVGIGLTDLPNIGAGDSGYPGPPGSGITVTLLSLQSFLSSFSNHVRVATLTPYQAYLLTRRLLFYENDFVVRFTQAK